MAYKFQRGLAKLSGSITAEEGLNANAAGLASAGEIAGATSVSASLGITGSNFNADGRLDIGGAASIGGALDAGGNITAVGSFIIGSADLNEADMEKIDDITNGQAALNKALVLDGNLDVVGARKIDVTGRFKVDGASGGLAQLDVDANNGRLRLANASDNYVIKFDIDNNVGQIKVLEANGSDVNFLVSSGSVSGSGTLNGSGVSVDGNVSAGTVLSDTLVVGRADKQDKIDFTVDNVVKIYASNAERIAMTAGGTTVSGQLTADSNLTVNGTASIAGDLIVQGTTVTLDVTTLGITGAISFEGSTANGAETTLSVIDPTADRTISLPDLSANGTLAVFSDSSWAGANITPSPVTLTELNKLGGATLTTTELNLLDKDTSIGASVTVTNADAFVFHDADGTMQKIPASDVITYVESNASLSATRTVLPWNAGTHSVLNLSASNAGEIVYASANATASCTINLPSSDAVMLGKSILIKASNADAQKVTIQTTGGSQKVDGEDSIVLESANAAVELYYVAADTFIII